MSGIVRRFTLAFHALHGLPLKFRGPLMLETPDASLEGKGEEERDIEHVDIIHVT